MKKSEQNLEQAILQIILDRFILGDRELIKSQICKAPAIYETPLTGAPFSMNGTELVYLFFEIQKVFNVYIDAHLVCNYEFMTIQGIADLIRCCCDSVAETHSSQKKSRNRQ